jgi:hypothetical protein
MIFSPPGMASLRVSLATECGLLLPVASKDCCHVSMADCWRPEEKGKAEMLKYEPPWSIRKMKGKFAVLECDEPSLVVLDGLAKPRAQRLLDYLVKLSDNQVKVEKMWANFDVDALRVRLRKMTDEQLQKFGHAARYMCSPDANMGKPPLDVFVTQLAEATAEWQRRNPKRA